MVWARACRRALARGRCVLANQAVADIGHQDELCVYVCRPQRVGKAARLQRYDLRVIESMHQQCWWIAGVDMTDRTARAASAAAGHPWVATSQIGLYGASVTRTFNDIAPCKVVGAEPSHQRLHAVRGVAAGRMERRDLCPGGQAPERDPVRVDPEPTGACIAENAVPPAGPRPGPETAPPRSAGIRSKPPRSPAAPGKRARTESP